MGLDSIVEKAVYTRQGILKLKRSYQFVDSNEVLQYSFHVSLSEDNCPLHVLH